MQDIIRRHMVFHGAVQGVGFRYRARHAASAVGATGWVRNEYDGSVTMELQGTEAQIDAVVEMIARGTFVDIEWMDARTVPVEAGERDFRTEG